MKLVEIIAFGQVAAVTGYRLPITHEVNDTDSLQLWLHTQYPALINIRYALAVNQKMISQNEPLAQGATVALLPPFSGG